MIATKVPLVSFSKEVITTLEPASVLTFGVNLTTPLIVELVLGILLESDDDIDEQIL